jgi:hypothetical protein
MLGKAPDSHSDVSEFDLHENVSIHKLKLSPVGIRRILAHYTITLKILSPVEVTIDGVSIGDWIY